MSLRLKLALAVACWSLLPGILPVMGQGGTGREAAPAPKKTNTRTAPAKKSGSAGSNTKPGANRTNAANEVAFWNSIKDSVNPQDFRDYLEKFPEGQFAHEARYRLASFAATERNAATSSAPTPACPINVRVVSPDNKVNDGIMATFTATVMGGSGNQTFHWAITAGTIVSGQGTSSIRVNTRGLGGQTIVATLSLGEPCNAGATSYVEVLSPPGAAPERATSSEISLGVTAIRSDGSGAAIASKDIAFYTNGDEQSIKSFSPDPSPARIVLLIDDSLIDVSPTLKPDDDKLKSAAREFAYEIYEGDKLLIAGYQNSIEIGGGWTDDAQEIESELKWRRKKGEPHLFDALVATANNALRPLTEQKRAIVVISDGFDRGSKSSLDAALTALQAADIMVYWVQAPARTSAASPNPRDVVERLTEGTGGKAFAIAESRAAASAICDELRKNRYVLSYIPGKKPAGELQRLLLVAESGINLRAKTALPAN